MNNRTLYNLVPAFLLIAMMLGGMFILLTPISMLMHYVEETEVTGAALAIMTVLLFLWLAIFLFVFYRLSRFIDVLDEKIYNLKFTKNVVKNLYDIIWVVITMVITIEAMKWLKLGLVGTVLPIPSWLEPVNLIKSLAIAIGIGAGAGSLFGSRASANKLYFLAELKKCIEEKYGKNSELKSLLAGLDQEQEKQKNRPADWNPRREIEILERIERVARSSDDKKLAKITKHCIDSASKVTNERNTETIEEIIAVVLLLGICIYIGNPAAAVIIFCSFFLLKQFWKALLTQRNKVYDALIAGRLPWDIKRNNLNLQSLNLSFRRRFNSLILSC